MPQYPDEPPGTAVRRASASNRRYSNVEPGLTVRDGASFDDRDYFRPEQAPPTAARDKVAACLQAYERFGVVRNTVDMMSEFAAQGADLVHPDPATERFYRRWWHEVRGNHVVERQLNLLYSAGTVPVKRTWGTLTPTQARTMRRGVAAYDTLGDVKTDLGPPGRERRVPWRYTLLNPLSLENLGGDVSPLIGEDAFRYGVRVNKALIEQLKDARKGDLYPRLHDEIDTLLSECGGGEVVPLPPGDVKVLWYKRHDWQLWATPMLFSLFRDLQMLEQLKLADMSALDGAASHVRLWQLGDVEHELWPKQAAVDKLADILAARSPGEVLDVIWGPDIRLTETKADGHQFLGADKYLPTWAAIFGGLGVPLSLTGVPGAAQAGTTNNWASLKTLVERLEYGRRVVREFWDAELRLVQRAMGFRKPAQVVFDSQSLSDEASVLRLLIELMDRNVVSREAVQERFSLIPEIERVRTRREHRQSRKGKIPEKAGPWDDPQFDRKVYLELLRQQRITPQQAGVGLEPDDALPAGEGDRAAPPTVAPPAGEGGASPKGEPGQGRPPGKKDSKPRPSPRFSPRGRAAFELLRAEVAALGVADPDAVAAELARRVEPHLPAGELAPDGLRRLVAGVYADTPETP